MPMPMPPGGMPPGPMPGGAAPMPMPGGPNAQEGDPSGAGQGDPMEILMQLATQILGHPPKDQAELQMVLAMLMQMQQGGGQEAPEGATPPPMPGPMGGPGMSQG